jgi:hypothetical protein
MKKAMFRQLYSTDGEVKVIKDKVEEVKEETVEVEEKEIKKEAKKKNGRKHII